MHFFCYGCSCAYVCIVAYAAGHGKECVTEMVRVESTDSPLSATVVVKTPPQGTGVCILAVKSCHHVSVAFLHS